MDHSGRFPISAGTLASRIGTAAAPLALDVRRGAAFDGGNRIIVRAVRRTPKAVETCRQPLQRGRDVVACWAAAIASTFSGALS
jgi:hypothetical protein